MKGEEGVVTAPNGQCKSGQRSRQALVTSLHLTLGYILLGRSIEFTWFIKVLGSHIANPSDLCPKQPA
jgi:hypothetical protein